MSFPGFKKSFLVLASLFFLSNYGQTNLTQYVNPFIGTGGHGHTFPGAVLPFGMVQLSPDTRIDGSWDGCSGYHYSDSIIYGFSHTHLSGTGISDWGDILIMPTVGAPSCDNKIYSSAFKHKNEKATAGFYEVLLDDDKVKAELTTTLRTGIHRYSFPKTNEANIILDLLHRDRTFNYNLTVIDSVTVSGFRMSEAWARDQEVFFVIRFSKPFKKMEFAYKKMFKAKLNFKMKERAQGAYFQFDVTDGKPLLLKVALSPVSAEGALKNLEAEAKHWDFEKYKKDAEKIWDVQLKKIEVADNDKNKLSVFYTALYHTCIHPSLNMDVDGQYRGVDKEIHTAKGFTNYSVFSLWDTYRALHPLFTIIERKRTVDFINTFLAQYSQSGRLPMWELSGNETNCMIGFHSVSVIADAMAKGINNFDTALVYKAVEATATYSAFGTPAFNKKGFLEIDDESESVSKTLEYGYDNWCAATIMKDFGKKKEMQQHLMLAQAYKNLYNDSTGLMRPRKNGNWLAPFLGGEINNHFTEGNSWQYSFYVPHDLDGLIKLHGSKQQFENKLDELFMTKEKLSGRDQSDVTGLIGQYAQGNEPSHHMAYLYNFVDKPQKTIQLTEQICNNFYKNTPDGLIGNEDCGQMSAWYVFSAMGMYPVCPGSAQYVLSSPLFSSIKINLENEKTFTIASEKKKEKIIGGYTINNKKTNNSWLKHDAIMAGGKMVYDYISVTETSNEYGKGSNGASTAINAPAIMPVPIISSASQVFKDKMEVKIFPVNSNAKIAYTIDGSDPTTGSKQYSAPFFIDANCTVKAIAFSDSGSSAVELARFYKLKNNFDVQLISRSNPQYSANGGQTLIDGINDDANWRKGNWLGFQYQDFECIVDLKKKKEISYLSLECLQDSRAWIVYPTVVYYYGSDDNKNYKLIDSVSNAVEANNYNVQIQRFEKRLSQKVNYGYVKVVAKNFGKLPEWHDGRGDGAFIFVDELEIE